MGVPFSTGRFKAVLPSEAPTTKRNGTKAQKYTREEIKLMRTLLPSFVFLEKSTEVHRSIAGTHWERVIQPPSASKNSKSSQRESTGPSQKSKLLTLYDEFFAYLEHHSPELRPVFRSSMQVRGKVLVHISIGMRTLMSSENFVDKVLPLVTTHRRFGVKLEHYEPLGQALLHAMEVVSGPDEWTPQVEDAWKRLFSHTSVILIRAQKRVDDRIAKEVAKPLAARRLMARPMPPPKKAKKTTVMPTVADLVPHALLGKRSVRESLQGPSAHGFHNTGGGYYETEAGSRHVAAASGVSTIGD